MYTYTNQTYPNKLFYRERMVFTISVAVDYRRENVEYAVKKLC